METFNLALNDVVGVQYALGDMQLDSAVFYDYGSSTTKSSRVQDEALAAVTRHDGRECHEPVDFCVGLGSFLNLGTESLCSLVKAACLCHLAHPLDVILADVRKDEPDRYATHPRGIKVVKELCDVLGLAGNYRPVLAYF
jgi:hypothetical protein